MEQILGKDEMLIRAFFTIKVVTVERFQPRGESVVRPVTFLLKGVSTGEVTEGSDIQLSQVFEVAADESHRNGEGRPLSALTLRTFDLKAIEPDFERFKAAHPTHP